ncbi:MAG: lytic transglycosylase domain-containing protein [Fimbriimonadaceae bacterium]|nr:lytic transglycosylase domain-containing protein [Fimbriimonadaceae bacterium]
MLRLRPLGPDGVQQRVREIEARVREITGEPKEPFSKALDRAQDALGGARPSPLKGEIGPDESKRPLGLGGFGMNVRPKFATAYLKAAAATAAQAAGIDPILFDALVERESGYDASARSRAGAMGLAQLMPETASELGVTDPFDPIQNLQGGAKYLARMMKEFGDPRLALAAYNAGPGRVREAGGVPNIPETQAYVEDILANYELRRKR